MTLATLPNFGQRVTARRPSAPSSVREMVVDIFAGAGGASLGIEAALGVCVDKAINHNPLMIQMHEANHPGTKHLPGDVWDYKPLEVTGGRRVGLLWASPDCTHFSRAKGGKPVSKKIRALAWVVIKWAREVQPRVIILENVPEFRTWGPLGPDNRPIAASKGKTFRGWLRALERCGYAVEHRELIAADYGVPTIRKRFFLIARCDGRPIKWPEQTHAKRTKIEGDSGSMRGQGFNVGDTDRGRRSADPKVSAAAPSPARCRLLAWRSAAECIDWSLPCPSIFERKRPLAKATQRRIANGIRKYVIEAAPPGPFIVTCNHGPSGGSFAGHLRDVADPMRTVTASRDAHGLVVPFLAGAGGPTYSGKPTSIEQPMGTLIAENHKALVAPFIAQLAHGDGPAGSTFSQSRSKSVTDPIGTVHAGGNNHALVNTLLREVINGHAINRCGIEDDRTQTSAGQRRRQNRETQAGARRKSFGGVDAGDGTSQDRVSGSSFLASGEAVFDLGASAGLSRALWSDPEGHGGQSPERGEERQSACEPRGDEAGEQHAPFVPRRQEEAGATTNHAGRLPADHESSEAGPFVQPDRICGWSLTNDGMASGSWFGGSKNDHSRRVAALLISYYGNSKGDSGGDLRQPLGTVVGRDRFGLVSVGGVEFQIADIGLRMLTPRELLRAQFGRFAHEYVLIGTQAQQVAGIGNSVPPELAELLVKANVKLQRVEVAA